MTSTLNLLLIASASSPSVSSRSTPADDHAALLVNLWSFILTMLLAGYAVLDGFDLGVGILHPFVPQNEIERRMSMGAIGPMWNGNEVWLVTFGGSLFAMFPFAYASAFSAFYIPFMLLLWMLIFRAISIEFRERARFQWIRRMWDWGFFIGSCGAALLFGITIGNALRGIPLDARGTFTGTLLDLLSPYCLMTGVVAVAIFAMHGAIYLRLKTEGELYDRLHGTMWKTWICFVTLFIICVIWTLLTVPATGQHLHDHPWLYLLAGVNVFAILNVARRIHNDKPRFTFASSSVMILTSILLAVAAVFPNIVTATDSRYSITVYDAASSVKTLTIGLIIVAIGVPLVATYTTIIYWTFRGKVKPAEYGH